MNENKPAEAEVKAEVKINKETQEFLAQTEENPAGQKPPAKPVKRSRVKGALSLIWTFVSTFVVACIVIVAIALVAVLLSGCSIYSVQTGSMSPSYPIGSLLLVKPYDAFEEIEVGDVITYLIDDEGDTVTHRVVSIDEENQKLTTKGDANAAADASPVLYANVIGKVIFRIPKIGAIVNVITTEENKNTIIIIIIILLCLSLLFDTLKSLCRNIKKRKQKRN